MNLPNMDLLSTLGIGAGLTALVAGWQQVKGFFTRLTGVIISRAEFRYMGSHAAQVYCRTKLWPTPTPFRTYDGLTRFIRPKGEHGVVFWEVISSKGRLYWDGWKPVWVSLGSSELPTGGSAATATFSFIRGTFNSDKLAVDVASCARFQEERQDRFTIIRLSGRSGKAMMDFAGGSKSTGSQNNTPSPPASVDGPSRRQEDEGRLVGWKENEIGERLAEGTDPLARLALTEEVEEAVAEVQRWSASKEWYEKRQIPWRRGLLLHGVPGTGKSSLVKAIGQKLNLPVYLLDISTMDNEEFHSAYQNALRHTPCIVLIEDIDAVFDGRVNIAAEKGKGMTYDCLLNVISGVESSDGVLLFVTTNHIEKVDPALGIPEEKGSVSSRPGRIDRAVEMPILDSEGRRKLAQRILDGCDPSWVEHMVTVGTNDTGAQFEDRCATTALNLYWSSDPKAKAPEQESEEAAA